MEVTMAAGVSETRVTRRRLLSRLAEASTAPAVVISAAAGSGKSTLAAQWANADPRPHAVIALAPHLDDAAALGRLIVDALEGFGAPAPRIRATITGTEPEFSATLLPAIRELTATRTHPFVLVVDDAHLLHETACHQLLAAVYEGLPPGSTIALVTRDTAPTWLARARAEAHLVEVRDLALDEHEAAGLFTEVGVPIDGSALADVLDRSEGWAVGLYLAALARRDGNEAASGDFRRYLGDYLQSQVLDALPADQVAFLLETSILEELSGPVCDAVTGRADGGAVLADLARRIQLVIELDATPPRYRYHHLLSECLQTKLQAEDEATAPRLHARAARWLADEGDLDAAIRHAKRSGELGLVGELVWSGILPCIGSGRPDRLRSWLADLEDRQIQKDRWLTLAASWLSLQEGDGARMQRWALAAETHAGRHWRGRVATDEYSASLATLLVLIGPSLNDAVALSGDALQGLPPDSGFRPPTAWLRGVALTLLGHLDEGRESILEAEALAAALDVPVIEADSLAFLGVLSILGGDREAGVSQVTRSMELIRQHDLDRLATAAHTVTAQAFAQAVVGDRRAAEATFAKARRLSGMVAAIAPWFAVTGRLLQARTAMLLGDGATARILANEAERKMTADLKGTLVESMLTEAMESLRSMAIESGSAVPLTTAEIRVLQFLPSHLSFPQIGQRLFLSQNTVKTHALSIYRKFGVSSRGEAVLRAQALGLVEPPAHA
jgi:LuxR family transcriptional regulator, maltose regulon positive regulatory protein